MDKLNELLSTDGEKVMQFVVDECLPEAFVCLSEVGLSDYEAHRQFEKLEVYITIKKRGQK